jgi:hypothetical protein
MLGSPAPLYRQYLLKNLSCSSSDISCQPLLLLFRYHLSASPAPLQISFASFSCSSMPPASIFCSSVGISDQHLLLLFISSQPLLLLFRYLLKASPAHLQVSRASLSCSSYRQYILKSLSCSSSGISFQPLLLLFRYLMPASPAPLQISLASFSCSSLDISCQPLLLLFRYLLPASLAPLHFRPFWKLLHCSRHPLLFLFRYLCLPILLLFRCLVLASPAPLADSISLKASPAPL